MNTRARVTALPTLLAAGIGLGAFGNLGAVFAQDNSATAAALPEGFPELNLTVEADGIKGMPAETAAGRYLVKISGTAPDPSQGLTGALVLQLPDGLTLEEAAADAQAHTDSGPSWYLDAHWGGGVQLGTNGSGWAVLDLTPGDWVVTTFYGTTMPVAFKVTGDMPTDLTEVATNVQIELSEMTIQIKGGAFVAGDNIVSVRNVGAQLHFVDISKVPDGTTTDQIDDMMEREMTGTPPAEGGLTEADFVELAYFPEISAGVGQFQPITLEAGTYFLACWAPDPETQMPHAMMGMWTLVTVE
ncbi:MAG: hypothetical protein KC435_04580 [Thermomicrobiales bacterium]|nr:hypothetical protein [Thermomicrobiales bacterium]